MISNDEIASFAKSLGCDPALLKAFLLVETTGSGFSKDGKLIIQFEPHVFSRELNKKGIHNTLKKQGNKYTVIGQRASLVWDEEWKQDVINITPVVINNGVEGQKAEWAAFNSAFSIDAEAAMLATSIGLPQIMGFNYAVCGYKSVHEMWDDFKVGEKNQVGAMVNFIKSNKNLHNAIINADYHLMAYYYNGSGYKALAKQLGTVPYDEKIRAKHNELKKLK